MRNHRGHLACLIHGQLLIAQKRQHEDQINAVTGFTQLMDRYQRAHRLAKLALHRQLPGALMRLDRQLRRMLPDLEHNLAHAKQVMSYEQRQVLDPHQLVAELDQLQEEFGHYEYRVKNQERILCVRTDPIELDYVYLGSFEIQLLLNDLGEPHHRQPFRCIALDPHPAANNQHVTHPHVSDGYLCTGDATAAIGSALEVGRLGDFFLLVRQVLQTYNPQSPYVGLDEWDAEPCPDCGYPIERDQSCYCESCGKDYCDQCMSYCRRCTDSLCRGCLNTCPICDDPVCDDCLSKCAACGTNCCDGCLEDDLCPDCLKEQQEQQDDDDSSDEPQSEEQPAGNVQAA